VASPFAISCSAAAELSARGEPGRQAGRQAGRRAHLLRLELDLAQPLKQRRVRLLDAALLLLDDGLQLGADGLVVGPEVEGLPSHPAPLSFSTRTGAMYIDENR
jgi:hypothetical protein